MSKTYSEAMTFANFINRFNYLKLSGRVGFDDPDVMRWLNQTFYHSPEWKKLRQEVMIRDNGCDLSHPDHPIAGRILVHHIEPITKRDIIERSNKLFDPENLICVSHLTHNAIHYGDEKLLTDGPVVRTPGDTCPWKRNGG